MTSQNHGYPQYNSGCHWHLKYMTPSSANYMLTFVTFNILYMALLITLFGSWPYLSNSTLGDTPFYKLYRCVPLHWVGFLRCFGLKMGIHPFLVWNWVWFSGELWELYERIHRFNSEWVRKKEKYANSRWIWWICLFTLSSNLGNSNIMWKLWTQESFLKARSENRYGF